MIAVTTICAANHALFRRAGDGGAVDVGVASGNRLGGKGSERVETAGGTEGGTAIVTLEQRDHGGGESGGVDALHEHARAIVLHDVGKTAGIENRARQPPSPACQSSLLGL